MSWVQSVFQFLPRVISTPEVKRDDEDTHNHRKQYGSFENPNDFHKRLNSKYASKNS